MDYIQTYFNKPLEELSYEDVSSFFQQEQEESHSLEFKSYPAAAELENSLDGIRKGITAFLNSDGGVLIWGAPKGRKEERNGKRVKIFSGDLSPLTNNLDKDWLINKISSVIIPLPAGIRVKGLKKNEEEKYIYVFAVTKSPYSPHQYENTYYVRLDGQNKPAPHYLIEALFRKISYPDVRGYVTFKDLAIAPNRNGYLLDIVIFMVNASPLQNEENVTYRLTIGNGGRFYVDQPIPGVYEMDRHQFINRNNIDILHYGMPDRHQERIYINSNEIRNNQLEFFLYFGGKKSPMKRSIYTLDLALQNYRYAISEKTENELIAGEEDTIEEHVQEILNS